MFMTWNGDSVPAYVDRHPGSVLTHLRISSVVFRRLQAFRPHVRSLIPQRLPGNLWVNLWLHPQWSMLGNSSVGKRQRMVTAICQHQVKVFSCGGSLMLNMPQETDVPPARAVFPPLLLQQPRPSLLQSLRQIYNYNFLSLLIQYSMWFIYELFCTCYSRLELLRGPRTVCKLPFVQTFTVVAPLAFFCLHTARVPWAGRWVAKG